MTPLKGYHAVTTHVRDIQKARAWYTTVLGLKEVHHSAELRSASFEVPGSKVPFSIHQFDAGCLQRGGRPPGTVTGIMFAVDNTEKAVADLQKRGVTITDPPNKAPWGAMLATIADPDGNEFVLTTPS